MTELTNKPLKRGIPGTPFYVELREGYLSIKVRGSHRAGINAEWSWIAEKVQLSGSAPAKLTNGLDYLRWVAAKAERRKNAHKSD